MTAVPNLETSRKVQYVVLHFVLWLLLLSVFFVWTLMKNSVSNCHSHRVIFSTSVGILMTLWLKLFQFKSWFYLLFLVRHTLRQNLYFHGASYNLPYKACRGNRHRKSKLPHYGNLTFGDRGSPHVARGSRTYKFDSKLGYPGEGWSKLTFVTWNARSLTFEWM